MLLRWGNYDRLRTGLAKEMIDPGKMWKNSDNLINLFHPGTGTIPPHLTGRNTEQAYFRNCVDLLLKKEVPDQDMIVYGPRGNGKTAMLRYLQRETLKESASQLRIQWSTPSEFRDLGELIGLLAANDDGLANRAGKFFRPLINNLSASTNFGVASTKTGLNRGEASPALKDHLLKITKKKPFIFIIDEAHALAPDIGSMLLNASQSLRGESCPFFLVLAGTPELTKTLSQAEASFWERSKAFPLGRLSLQESVEALVKPIETFEIRFAEGVAEEVAIKAHCYPFFIQLWGQCLMEELVDRGQASIDRQLVFNAEPRVKVIRDQMYSRRFSELEDRDMLSIAGEIAGVFAVNDNKPIPISEIHELIGDREILKALESLGYIWQVEDSDMLTSYEPGIPSLMDFIQCRTVGMTPSVNTAKAESR